jgi:hypothetical protein
MAALDPQSTRHVDDGITARAMASRRPRLFEQSSPLADASSDCRREAPTESESRH